MKRTVCQFCDYLAGCICGKVFGVYVYNASRQAVNADGIALGSPAEME